MQFGYRQAAARKFKEFVRRVNRTRGMTEMRSTGRAAVEASLSDTFSGVVQSSSSLNHRATVRGKFLYTGDHKLWIGGVTYGTFRPDERGMEFHDRALVERDFRLMAASGINAIRTYTVPPVWFLDLASECNLHVM